MALTFVGAQQFAFLGDHLGRHFLQVGKRRIADRDPAGFRFRHRVRAGQQSGQQHGQRGWQYAARGMTHLIVHDSSFFMSG
ncbi:hypothetical protein LP419_22385 [Massilia sp. H-1]|nr:hypothetical protein LP419_22385 [Massilia sp. H-1]